MKSRKDLIIVKYLKILIIPFLLLIGVVACGGSGGQGSTDIVSCTGDDIDDSCGLDLDGDGLSYMVEKEGWEVAVDKFGMGGTGDVYKVYPDPEKADTDNDGLNDYEEYISKTDPTKADTDQDGLTDAEELNRWVTNPLSVDSDGDARGDDGDIAPNSIMFDSAELKIDLQNDQSHTPGAGATSPLVKDTDGDGWSDYYEIIEAFGQGFEPAIADLPLLGIEIEGTPVIRLEGETSTQTDWNKNVSVTNSLAESVSTNATITESSELTIESTVGAGVEFGFEIGKDPKIMGKFSVEASLSNATSDSQSIAWGNEQSVNAEQVYQESVGEGGSESVTLTGGYITLPVKLINRGNITYSLQDLVVNVLARYVDGTSNYAPVLELKREDNFSITLPPKSSESGILLKTTTEDYELIRSFLKNPSGLMFEVSSYNMVDQDGVNFGFSEETIWQKTAMLVLDYGGVLKPERYMVATSPGRDAAGIRGVTMATILNDIVGIDYQTVIEDGRSNLSEVRTVMNEAGGLKKWLVATSIDIDEDNIPDFDDIRLQAGDSIYLLYVQDMDSDGIPAREEFLLGSSDQNADTDGDGLSDYAEMREGWPVHIEGQLAYNVLSRGFSADSDSDGIGDVMEKLCGLDPILKDTDKDGISDFDEIYGYDIRDVSNNLVLTMVPYSGAVILDGGNELMETEAAGDDIQFAMGSTGDPVTNGAIIITAGPNEVIDSTVGGDDYVAVTHPATACNINGYATNPLNIDTDGESVPDGIEMQVALSSPNDSSDFAVYIDEDGDGLSNAVEELGFSTLVNGVSTHFTSNVLSGDSDADGLPDLLEFKLTSNPSEVDTDGDGLSDYDEYDFLRQWNNFVLACDAAQDCTAPFPGGPQYGTEINHRDTDRDGLNDSRELISGWTVSMFGRKTTLAAVTQQSYSVLSDPFVPDADLDGWNDSQEYAARTDPGKMDTDGDTLKDSSEPSTCFSLYSTNHCRSPVSWDRAVKVTYEQMVYSGECDPWDLIGAILGYDFFEEVDYFLHIKKPGVSNYATIAHGQEVVTANLTVDLNLETYNYSAFVMNYGEDFVLFGHVAEIDANYYTDVAFAFGHESCGESCTPYSNGFLPLDTQTNTRFILTDTEFPLWETGFELSTYKRASCGLQDTVPPVGFDIWNFSSSVKVKIEVK